MKAITLGRESKDNQDSNEAQIERMRGYTKAKVLDILKEYKIKESSTKEDRKQFTKIIEEISNSKEPCIAFVVDTIDRMQRRVSNIG